MLLKRTIGVRVWKSDATAAPQSLWSTCDICLGNASICACIYQRAWLSPVPQSSIIYITTPFPHHPSPRIFLLPVLSSQNTYTVTTCDPTLIYFRTFASYRLIQGCQEHHFLRSRKPHLDTSLRRPQIAQSKGQRRRRLSRYGGLKVVLGGGVLLRGGAGWVVGLLGVRGWRGREMGRWWTPSGVGCWE